jgi:small neutral amino acid transporter SnatA (MarC family)
MDHPFISTFLLLMLILSPINYFFMQFEADRSVDRVQRRRHLLKTGSTVILLLAVAILLGQMMWTWFPISYAVTRLGFGLMLFVLAATMIFANYPRPTNSQARFFYQLYFLQFFIRIAPVMVVNVVLLSANQSGNSPALLFACVCVLHFFCLLVSFCDRSTFGKDFPFVILGIQKLIGLLLAIVAVEKMMGGARQYFVSN